MDNWERFDETSLTDKESFYSSLTQLWLGFFMDVKWLGRGGKNYPPPLVISRTKQVRNMIFLHEITCLKYFLKM